MKKYATFAGFIAIAIVASTSAKAAEVSASAGGRIITALEITKSTDLYFGSIVPSASQSDQVVVSSAGELKCGDNLTCLGDGVSPAGFDLSGEADHTYSVTLPDSVTISNGSESMTISDLTDSVAGSSTLSGAGTDAFTVGGTLSVSAAQSAGVYRGTFSVAVEYN